MQQIDVSIECLRGRSKFRAEFFNFEPDFDQPLIGISNFGCLHRNQSLDLNIMMYHLHILPYLENFQFLSISQVWIFSQKNVLIFFQIIICTIYAKKLDPGHPRYLKIDISNWNFSSKCQFSQILGAKLGLLLNFQLKVVLSLTEKKYFLHIWFVHENYIQGAYLPQILNQLFITKILNKKINKKASTF